MRQVDLIDFLNRFASARIQFQAVIMVMQCLYDGREGIVLAKFLENVAVPMTQTSVFWECLLPLSPHFTSTRTHHMLSNAPTSLTAMHMS